MHGGALPPAPAAGGYAARRTRDVAAKTAIARAAAGLARDGDVIFLDGGTTTLQVARHLAPDLRATVLTNSPPIAVALVNHPGLRVCVVGGELDKEMLVAVGAAAVEAIRSVRADLCYLGVCALHPEIGITTTGLEERHVKRAMIESSAQVVALASAGKLGGAGPLRGGRARRADAPRDRRLRLRRGGRRRPRRRRRGGARMRARSVDARARVALTVAFVANGIFFGTLAARIPAIKDRLDLSDGALGVALLFVAVGVLCAFPVVGRLIATMGSRPVTRLALVLDAAAIGLVGLAPSLATLIVAAFALGAANAALDVAMNAHGVALERRYGRPILSSLHAGWSIGGLVGAALGGLLAAAASTSACTSSSCPWRSARWPSR